MFANTLFSQEHCWQTLLSLLRGIVCKQLTQTIERGQQTQVGSMCYSHPSSLPNCHLLNCIPLISEPPSSSAGVSEASLISSEGETGELPLDGEIMALFQQAFANRRRPRHCLPHSDLGRESARRSAEGNASKVVWRRKTPNPLIPAQNQLRLQNCPPPGVTGAITAAIRLHTYFS